MTKLLNFLLIPHDLKARLALAVLFTISLCILFVFVVPEIGHSPGIYSGLFLYFGGAIFFTQVDIDPSKKLEPML